jgi:fumarylacetoacetase
VTATWLDLPADSLFGPDNLPFGVFSTGPDGDRRAGVAIGDRVLDVSRLDLPNARDLAAPTLNGFLSRGPGAWAATRGRLQHLLADPAHRADVEPWLLPRDEVTLHLPIEVADYVDFYSSRHHAENVGRILRPGSPPLTPNWRHLPIGYHGRAGTVQVSGTPVLRPCGQRRDPLDSVPTFGPSRQLDVEAEVGFVVGAPSDLGTRVPVGDLDRHVFGVCLVNDWSARDLQAWEYVPLGPFLAKSFLTSTSPWLVPLAALAHARTTPPDRDPQPLPYLRDDADPWALDITLEIRWNGALVSSPPFAGTYWTAAQQLAHLTVNGASLRTGDLVASGTVSGPEKTQRGSFLELSWGGTEPVQLPDGTTRTFLEDGDTVSITATAPGPDGTRIGFGEVTGRVHPAR